MNSLVELLRELLYLLEELGSVEEAKLEAVRDRKVTAVEELMKTEEAYTLKFRFLEKKLKGLLGEAGMEGRTLREMLPDFPEQDRQEAERLYDGLRERLAYFQEVNGAASDLMQIQLHKVSRKIENAGIYGKNGEDLAYPGGFHSRKA